MYPKDWSNLQQASDATMLALAEGSPKLPQLKEKEQQLRKKWGEITTLERKKWNARWAKQEGLPKVAMLSATPFAYAKNTDYAEGYLFHYVAPAQLERAASEGAGYNTGSPRQQFMMSNFGYRMKTNKLTAPESGVRTNCLSSNLMKA